MPDLSLPARALSLTWPWPHFMFCLPPELRKTIENRKLGFSHKSFRGESWVHVTPCKSHRHFEWACAFARAHHVPEALMPQEESKFVGHIIGRWTVVDRLPAPLASELPDRWRMEGQFGFVVENPRLVAPVPCRGSLGFWRVPSDVLALLERGA